MPQEFERKYLVRLEDWKPTTAGVLYRQGYLSSVKERVVRVRVAGEQGYLTIKGLMRGAYVYPSFPSLSIERTMVASLPLAVARRSQHAPIVIHQQKVKTSAA